MTAGSVIKNLRIENWPVHLFSISGCSDLTFQNLILDNTAGEAPNNRSNGLAAAHNSDGFDLSSSNNVLITDSTVLNQDDCVAITSGNNVTVSNMYCSGGHGLSIGSVGGKSNNNVTNILVRLPPFSPNPTPKLTTIHSSPTAKSSTPKTAPASKQTTTPQASSPTSPTVTFSSQAPPSTASMSKKITSMAALLVRRPMVSSFRMCSLAM